MERIHARDHEVQSLSAALSRCRGRHCSPIAADASDPAAELERLRVSILDAAREQGYNEGIERAGAAVDEAVLRAQLAVREEHRALREELHEASERLTRMIEELPVAVHEHELQLERAVAEIAYESLLRVLGALNLDRNLVVRICESVLHEQKARPAVLHACIADYPVLSEIGVPDELRLVEDPSLRASAFRLESMKGTYETGLELRLQSLLNAFVQSQNREEAS